MAGMQDMHFIAGLPRSGSTLLSAILRQNPAAHALMSSPLEHIVSTATAAMSGQNYFYHFLSDEQRERIVRGIFESYYADIPQQWIFDTNRNWTAKMPAIMRLFPQAKVICCVRDLVSIVNSFEHLVMKNPFEISRLYGWDPKLNVYGRYERLIAGDGTVGRAMNALKEAYYGSYASSLIVIEYDTLVRAPQETIASIYSSLGMPAFTHDFNNLAYEASEFDSYLGLRDMHTVRKTISPEQKPIILPTDLVERLRGAEFWKRTR